MPPSSRRNRAPPEGSRPRRATSTSPTGSGRGCRARMRPTSSCRGRCCSGSTSARGSSSRSTSTSPRSSEFDLADFLPRLLEVNRWSGRAGDPLGAGPLLEIPVNCESYNLAYRAAHPGRARARRAADVGGVLRRGARRRAPGGEVRGFGQRGRGEWHTMYTGFATQLWSCGGRDFDPDGRAAFADADAVAVTAGFIEALREPARSTGRTSAGTSSRSTSPAAGTRCSSTPIITSPSSRTSASPSWSGGSATRCPRQVRRANAVRISGRGRWR